MSLQSGVNSVVIAVLVAHGAIAFGYDPLAVPEAAVVEPVDLDVDDAKRDRTIPIRVFLPPDGAKAAPVVLFSHGLGGSREMGGYLGKHWAGRGYAAVFLQHPGSDTSVWRNVPLGQRMKAMREAASAKNLLLRVEDVPAVLDQLDAWTRSKDHQFAGRFDLVHAGMSGHSFGAMTTQAVGGQRMPLVGDRYVEPRIKAAVMMSPGSPRGRRDPGDAFSDVKIPWLLMTGTEDTSPIGGQTVESRLAVFPALPKGHAYELVLDRAEHSAFTDRPLPGDREPRNPNHHRAILALSTAFWDAYLRDNAEAHEWLDGDGPQTILEKGDRWQRK
jgi:predicted dienelactone hydrolase